MTKIKTLPTLAYLADEIFSLVQYDQGKGFVSDALDALPDHDAFFKQVRAHLMCSERAVDDMRRFLRKYGQLTPR